MSPLRLFSVAALGILLSGAGYFSFGLYKKYREIYVENKCDMTFMWRRIFLMPIPVPNNDVGRYSLLHYSEGMPFQPDFVGSSSDIPVLFVPGSGGSGAQVRSLASVMQNKTEMKRAPFRMHFYALDFQEEISALSGNTLIRQRNFLMKAIHILRGKYPLTKEKMILFGHSFGGVVIRSLPLHPEFNPNYMSLVLTLAAPLLQSPVVLDFPMANFYDELEELWDDAPKHGIDHVRFFSFSGGEKDVLVPDRLVTADHTIHLPSWSISGVATPTDHLCILWCNQLVRYTSRILFDYGQKATEGLQNPNLTLQIADDFLVKESKRLMKMKDIIALNKDKMRMSLSETGTVLAESSPNEAAFRLDLSDHLAYRIHVQCKDSRGYSCSEKLRATILHPNGRRTFGEDGKLHGIRVKSVFLRPEQGPKSYLILQAPENNVDYTISVEEDFFASWYMIVTSYASDLMSSVILGAVLLVPVIELLKISPSTVRLTFLAVSTAAIAARLFYQDIIALGILSILLLLDEVQPWLGLLFKKLHSRYVYLPLAVLHPDLAIISSLLRSRRAPSSTIYQLVLLLCSIVVFPSIFEGGLPPKIDLPSHFYRLGADLTIANPAWLVFAAEFGNSKGILSKMVKFAAGYSCFGLLLSRLVFQQLPLHFYPSLLAHLIYLTGF